MIWPLTVVLAAGLVLVAVLVAGRRLFPGTRPARRAFRCPFRDRDVSAEFAEGVWDGRYEDVTRCSLFVPPTAVDCAKGCLRLSVTR
jgi:hypothetical protein